MKLWIAFLLLSTNASYAAERKMYFTMMYGPSTTRSADAFTDGILGKNMGLAFGVQGGGAMAWEFLVRQTSFDSKSKTLDLTALGGSTYSLSIEPKNLFIGLGPRVFLFKILNLHTGIGFAKTTVAATITGGDIVGGTGIADKSGAGFYYGAGAQIPLGSIEFGADYTISSITTDINSENIVGNLRIRF